MTLVRFAKRYGPYNSGEIAGFTDDVAKAMVNRGIAEFAKQNQTTPKAENDDVSKSDNVHPSPLDAINEVEPVAEVSSGKEENNEDIGASVDAPEEVIEPQRKGKKRRGFFKGKETDGYA